MTMKFMKKLSLVLFAVCTLLLCTVLCAANISAASVVDSGICGDNLTWSLSEDGSLTIEGTGETWIWDPYEMAPWHSMCDSITSVTLAEGITALNDMAFAQCSNITSIVIPESVAFISECVFSYCSSLSEIVILNDSITILEDAFKYNDSNTFTLYGHEGSAAEAYAAQYGYRFAVIEDSAAEIIDSGVCGENMTWTLYDNGELVISGEGEMDDWNSSVNIPWNDYRSSIRSVIIEDGVTSIEFCAFYACRNLTKVFIGAGVESINSDAFDNTSMLTQFIVDENNPYFDSENGILYSEGKATLVKFPEGKTDTSYTIPDSVTTIGSNAIGACSLETLTIPESVISIAENAFYGNSTITGITVDTNNSIYASDENGVLFNKNKNILVLYPMGKTDTHYTVPEGVMYISSHAFDGTPNLVSVTLPTSLLQIGFGAFQSAEKLTEITIPANVSSIDSYAFGNCGNLLSITILSDNITLEYNAFTAFAFSGTKTIYGYQGSTAETYAEEYGFEFSAIEKPETEPVIEPVYTPGDISGDGFIDISDAVMLFQHSMIPDLYPLNYAGNLDLNKDGVIDITDAVILFKHSMLPDLYPLESEGAYEQILRRLVNGFDFLGVNTFYSPEMLSVYNIIELSVSFADYYNIDFTPYREYENDWLYIDYIPISVMDTLIERMWGIKVDYSQYNTYNTEYFGYDAEAQIFRYSNVGGRSHITTNFFDSYTIKDNQITVLVKQYNVVYEKPEFGVEGEDWYMEPIWGEDAYFVFSDWKEINVSVVDGYIRVNSFIRAK